MCGIGGILQWGSPSSTLNPSWSQAMLAQLRQRGPDGQVAQGFNANFQPQNALSPSVHTLLHARLAIIDPHPHSAQPMSDATKTLWLVFNGEIYNWRVLRAELARDYPFRTQSDSEVILAGFRCWGFSTMLSRIEGMFAFAILNTEERKIYLARDRLGKKPLLYHLSDSQSSGIFAFASTVNALLPLERAFPPSQQGINPLGVDAFLTHRTIFPPNTLYRGIQRVPSAHAMEVDLVQGVSRINRYWSPQVTTPSMSGREDLQAGLSLSVLTRLSSDRPVGLFLSGGVDSAVVANAIPINQRNAVQTFTAQFDDLQWDESEAAALTAKTLGFSHQNIPISPNLRDDFSRLVADFDDPFADPSAIPSWYLARTATNSVKVVLSGDGGDEFFGGYKRYQQHLRIETLAAMMNVGLMRHSQEMALFSFSAELFPTTWQKTLWEAKLRWYSPQSAYALRFSGFAPWQRLALYQGNAPPNMRLAYWQHLDNSAVLTYPHRHALETLMAIDAENYLPEYILRKGDLACMAHGLEMRQPFLSYEWIEQVLSLPLSTRLERPPKAILIQMLPQVLRDRLLHSKKRGFNPPLRKWLTVDLADRLPDLGKRLAQNYEGLSAESVQACVRALISPRYKQEAKWSEKMAERVFQLLVLDEHLQNARNAASVINVNTSTHHQID